MSGLPMDLARANTGLPALKRQFPHLEEDALALFLETAEGACLSNESLAALMEMEKDVAAGKEDQFGHLPTRGCKVQRNEASTLEVLFEGGDSPPHVGTVLHISGLERPDTKAPWAGIVLPTGEVLALQVCQDGPTSFLLEDFGMHELRLCTGSAVERSWFMVSSPLGEYGEALDLFNDAYDWVWDGSWNNELEESVLNLLVALDDAFQPSASGGVSISDMVKSSLASPKQRIQKYLSKAIESQDPLSLGRAVGSLRAMTLVQSLYDTFTNEGMQGNQFYQTIIAFETERLKASSSGKQEQLNRALRRMVLAADAHVADLYSYGRGQDFIQRWSGGLRSEIWAMLEGQAPMHPMPFQQMRGGGGGYVADMLASIMSSGASSGAQLARAETMEAMTSLAPEESFAVAQSKMKRWCESLVDEQISIGHPMSPFELKIGDADRVLATLHSTLSLGLGYVSSTPGEVFESARLVALLDRVRASLPLHAQQDFLREKKRKERLKDVCRVLRAARKKGYRLSLSVNTDFKGALQALREHHEDNWVGPALEAVWDLMLERKRVFAFELWLHEADKPKQLVAADFGHAHTFGRAYYVATRFFDRTHRTLQPGFLLAYAEAECLRRAGFELWDLGGADHSPMMQYKPQVALEMHRSEFLLRLLEISRAEFAAAEEDQAQNLSRAESLMKPMTDLGAAPPPCGERVPQGVVFEDIQEEDLWGAVALKSHDQPKAKGEKNKSKKPQGKAAAKETQAVQVQESVYTPPPRPKSEQPSDKDDAKRLFLSAYQQFLAEGLSETEAAAKALKSIRG
ncbi:Uncharacterized protein SCF082_LOCUS27180 [Durusdinium trenchii]|uniref:Uncharacterized protein n=1 Tax=Durusdinium trenchii TaxID=1381693 RepID=A0ABP0MCV9_9DINO